MNLLIAMKDEVFARMLELECTDRGAQVTLAFTPEDIVTALPSSAIVLLDAAFLTNGAFSPDASCPRILLGYPDELARIPLSEISKYYAVARPFSVEELIESIFGKKEARPLDFHPRKKKSPADNIALDTARHTAYYKGEKVPLTPKEFALLRLLLERRGTPVAREVIAPIFGEESTERTNVADVYINYLRNKFDHHFHIRLISTVRGCGYVIE